MPHFVWETLLGDEEAHGLIDKTNMEYDAEGNLARVKYYRGNQVLFEKEPIYEDDKMVKINIIVDGKVKFAQVLIYDAEGNVTQVVTERF